MSCLVDTNILSELAKPLPNPGVMSWARGVSQIALSAVTVEEVYFGLSWKPHPRVEQWLEAFLRQNCRVLPVTDEVARQSGVLRGALRVRGFSRTQADMLIAATAHVHALTLVTRNERDFADCGITVLNPFSPLP